MNHALNVVGSFGFSWNLNKDYERIRAVIQNSMFSHGASSFEMIRRSEGDTYEKEDDIMKFYAESVETTVDDLDNLRREIESELAAEDIGAPLYLMDAYDVASWDDDAFRKRFHRGPFDDDGFYVF